MTSYLIVAPHYVARRSSLSAALRLARLIDRDAASAYGAGAGADCAIIADRDGVLEYRGMACGRSLIGRSFGCGPGYLARAQSAVDAGSVRG